MIHSFIKKWRYLNHLLEFLFFRFEHYFSKQNLLIYCYNIKQQTFPQIFNLANTIANEMANLTQILPLDDVTTFLTAGDSVCANEICWTYMVSVNEWTNNEFYQFSEY